MNILKKTWIRFLKATFCTCGEITFLLAKEECSKLSFREKLKVKMHLWKCNYCRYYIEEQKFVLKSLDTLNHKIELDKFLYHLTPEQKERLKKSLDNS